MKVKTINAKNVKRFTELTITDIPETAKLILIVGPNGSGKSSLFDCFLRWYRSHTGFGLDTDLTYYQKLSSINFDQHNAIQIEFFNNPPITKKSMYFRSAYRNDPDFTVNTFTKVGAPSEQLKFGRLIDNDQAVSGNYQRLIHSTMAKLYDLSYDSKTVLQLRNELIGKIQISMRNVFSDLCLNNIGDPLSDGTFKFDKGTTKSFLYKNLSGGEKAAFDLILDLVIKIDDYQNTVFFIDEPETHMHTSLQASLIREIFAILPKESQLWINTHSFGIIQEAKEIECNTPGSVVILDFADRDFDSPLVITPSTLDKVLWEKFLSISLGDIAKMVAPSKIFICEGDYNGIRRKDFDAEIYNQIFKSKYPDVVFISGGSCLDIIKDDNPIYIVLKNLLKSTSIHRLVDRDDYSQEEVIALRERSIKVLSLRHLESYLFDDEILQKLTCTINESLLPMVLESKRNAILNSVSRGNQVDDIKSASGEIYVELKRILNITKCGNNTDAFMRDSLAKLVTQDTVIYSQLERDIF